jgi:hypothetical protein
VDLFADGFYAAAVTVVGEDDRVAEIRSFVGSFGVDSHQIKFFPYFFEKAVEVELHVAADDDGVGLFGEKVDLLERDGVDLIVAVETLHKLTISYVEHFVPSMTSMRSSMVLSSWTRTSALCILYSERMFLTTF